MNKYLKIFSAALLLINSFGALFGGWKLFSRPDGSGLGIPLEVLKFSPFTDYFIPGIILFIVNGIFGLFVFALLFFRSDKYPLLLFIQGVLLSGWIIIQVVMLRAFDVLHGIFLAIGILMILLGLLLKTKEESAA